MAEVYRHKSGKGSVIEFQMFGKDTKILVPDTRFLDTAKYTMGFNNTLGFSGGMHYIYDRLFNKLPGVFFMQDINLDETLRNFSSDNSGSENTTLLNKDRSWYAGAYADSFKLDDLNGFCIPNLYEMAVICSEMMKLSELDPSDNTEKFYGIDEPKLFWTSTTGFENMTWTVDYLGFIVPKNNDTDGLVIPIKEF